MSQATDWSVPLSGPVTPNEMADRMDKSLDALLSSHSGASRPAYAVAGTVWLSTAVAGKHQFYEYDGADDRPLFTIDTATGAVSFADVQPRVDVASAATANVGAASSAYVNITGTTAITAFDNVASGVVRRIRFAAALTLTHNAASLVLPNGGANITTAVGDHCVAVSMGGGNWVVTSYQRVAGMGVTGTPKAITGLTIANGTDATNDIDVAIGAADNSASPYNLLSLVSALTKQLDALWAVGTNQGMRDTGAIADGWWYIYPIRRPDTGVVDILASLSATSPTMPANYTEHGDPIAAILRTSGAIKAFTQFGRKFVWVTPALDFNSGTLSTTGALVTLTVPPISGVDAHIGAFLTDASGASVFIRETTQTNDVVGTNNADLSVSGTSIRAHSDMTRFVDGSGQVRYKSNVASVTLLRIETKGFRLPT